MSKLKRVRQKNKKTMVMNTNPHHYFNRDLSWLEFNSRVLAQAFCKETPLLERFRFIAIYFSNLDEFVMKRVGGIERYRGIENRFRSADGLGFDELLKLIRQKITEDNSKAEDLCLSLFENLKKEEIHLLDWKQLTEGEKEFCHEYFQEHYFPILTPLSVDPGHPFPFISNMAYSFGIYLEDPDDADDEIFSRVKIPTLAHRFIELPKALASKEFVHQKRLIGGDLIIRENLHHLYRGLKIKEVMPFRLTRNADWDHDDEDTEDLLEAIEESINERRLQEPIRIETFENANDQMLTYLIEETEVLKRNVYFFKKIINFQTLHSLANLDVPKLRYAEWKPITPLSLAKGSIFEKIRERDRLLHHPYESFSSSVERLISVASRDPNVITIKITLYRSGENSLIIKSLIDAAKDGKQVVCLVELKARFDEKINIFWARKLEQAGVHVVYGVVGLKTHSKIALIVRKEPSGKLLRYAHIGTGNYNAKTAKLYTDLGLLTIDPRITTEISEVFNFLTGTSLKKDYNNLLVCPLNAKESFLQKIKHLSQQATKGIQCRIIAKMNALEDLQITNALYEASMVGVKIDLIVRGFCCLKPGVKGLSEKISVYSVVGRFLEHSRVYAFSEGESSEVYIGSADWMHRNLHGRVEVLVPIYNLDIKQRLFSLLELQIGKTSGAWKLNSSGTYELVDLDRKQHCQNEIMKKTIESNKPQDL